MAEIITACAPILVALIAIIPTILSSGKKTRESVQAQNEATQAQNEANQAQMAGIQSTLEAHIREDEDDKARNARYRILRFYDEICEGRRHSESHFEDILEDIDRYERYCAAHPGFRNSRGSLAMRNIQSTYERLKIEGKFLAHEKDKEEERT